MLPLPEAITELRLVIQRLESRRPGTPNLEDFRTEVVAELIDTIDRIDPGWGDRLMVLMYPQLALATDDAR